MCGWSKRSHARSQGQTSTRCPIPHASAAGLAAAMWAEPAAGGRAGHRETHPGAQAREGGASADLLHAVLSLLLQPAQRAGAVRKGEGLGAGRRLALPLLWEDSLRGVQGKPLRSQARDQTDLGTEPSALCELSTRPNLSEPAPPPAEWRSHQGLPLGLWRWSV